MLFFQLFTFLSISFNQTNIALADSKNSQNTQKGMESFKDCLKDICIIDKFICENCTENQINMSPCEGLNCKCGCDESKSDCKACDEDNKSPEQQDTKTGNDSNPSSDNKIIHEAFDLKSAINKSTYKVDILWVIDDTISSNAWNNVKKSMNFIVDSFISRQNSGSNISLRFGILKGNSKDLIKNDLKNINKKLKHSFKNEILSYSLGRITKTRALYHSITWYLHKNYAESFFRTSKHLMSSSKKIVAFVTSDDSKKYPKPRWMFLAIVLIIALISLGVGTLALTAAKATAASSAAFYASLTAVSLLALQIENKQRQESFKKYKRHIHAKHYKYSNHPKAEDFLSIAGELSATRFNINDPSKSQDVRINKYPNFEVWSFGSYLPSKSYSLLHKPPKKSSQNYKLSQNSQKEDCTTESKNYNSMILNNIFPKYKFKIDHIRHFDFSKPYDLAIYYFCYTSDPQIEEYFKKIEEYFKEINENNNFQIGRKQFCKEKRININIYNKEKHNHNFTMCSHIRPSIEDIKNAKDKYHHKDYIDYHKNYIDEVIERIIGKKKKLDSQQTTEAEKMIKSLRKIKDFEEDLLNYLHYNRIDYPGAKNIFVHENKQNICSLNVNETPRDKDNNTIDKEYKHLIVKKNGAQCKTKYQQILTRANIKTSSSETKIYETIHALDKEMYLITPADPIRAVIYNVIYNKIQKVVNNHNNKKNSKFNLQKQILQDASLQIKKSNKNIKMSCGRQRIIDAENVSCINKINTKIHNNSFDIYAASKTPYCRQHRKARQYQIISNKTAGISFSLCNASQWNKLIKNALTSEDAVFFERTKCIHLEDGRILDQDANNIISIHVVDKNNKHYALNKCLVNNNYLTLTPQQICFPNPEVSHQKLQKLIKTPCGRNHYSEFLQKLRNSVKIKIAYKAEN